MSIAERIIDLRKNKIKATQEEFARAIFISRSNLANIESGRIGTTERNIKNICKVYGINELWLTTGEGEVFCTKDDELDEFVGKILKDEDPTFVKRFVRMLASLDTEEWEILEKALDILKRVN